MTVHPVFQQFNVQQGPADPNVFHDWLGGLYPRHLIDTWPSMATEAVQPVAGEELFEWIDVLTAASEASGRFAMVELGAGWGRWGIRGALAARHRGLTDIDVRLVEAEPLHCEFARECVVLNGLSASVRLIEAAISYSGQQVPFIVSSESVIDARTNYGQWVYDGQTAVLPSGETYLGREVYRYGGHGCIYVESITLEEVLAGLDRVDLLDADLQGAEKSLVENAMEVMTAKVALAHFGTHGAEIEELMRDQFRRYGWKCRWDFSLGGVRDTPYGPTDFQDGVQAWVNPALIPSSPRIIGFS